MATVSVHVAPDAGHLLAPRAIGRRMPGRDEVPIGLRYCRVSHADVPLVRGGWGGAGFAMGHGLAGRVPAVGQTVSTQPGGLAGVCGGVDCCQVSRPRRAGRAPCGDTGMAATSPCRRRRAGAPA